LQAAIKKEFGITASLQGGHSGVFDVVLDGTRIYSKDETYRFPTNDAWCRDHGPIFVKNDRTGEVALTDWRYNAWGDKYPPYDLDNRIPPLIAQKLKVGGPADVQRVYLFLGESIIKNEPIKELISPEVAGTVWKEMVRIADKYNQPGKFTTFVAYEWTSTPDNRNMHRNVFFKDSRKVPELPFTSIDSVTTVIGSQRPRYLYSSVLSGLSS